MKKLSCLLLMGILLSLTACSHTHTFSPWTTVKAGDCTANGLRERACECGEREQEMLAAPGHSLDDDGFCTVCGAGEKQTDPKQLTTGSRVETGTHKFTVGKIAFVTGLKEKVGDTVYSKGEGDMLVIQLTFTNLAEEPFDYENSDRVSGMLLEYGGKFHYEGEYWVPAQDIAPQTAGNLYITYAVPKSVGKDTETCVYAAFSVDGKAYRVTVRKGSELDIQEEQHTQPETDDGRLTVGERHTDGEKFAITLTECYYTDQLTATVGNVTYTKAVGGRVLVLRLRFENLAADTLEGWGSDRIRDMRLIHAEQEAFSGSSWLPAQQILPLEEGDLYIVYEITDDVETGTEPLLATFTVDGSVFTVDCRAQGSAPTVPGNG